MRIRSIKPEFFDSPSTAEASPWARLLYIAMWCMADDWGVGQANPKEMAANAFPNDDQWTGKELPSLCKEVADAYGVLFYTHQGRRYFQIPSWEEHQVTQRRAKRRHPTFDDPNSVPDLGFYSSQEVSKELPSRNKENASTEQGNRGAGEQGNSSSSSEVADATRPEVEALVNLLNDLIEQNGSKRPNVTKKNLDAARLLLDKDGYTVEQVEYIIRWSQSDEFWRANILSMSKLREKFDQMKLKSQQQSRNENRAQYAYTLAQEVELEERRQISA